MNDNTTPACGETTEYDNMLMMIRSINKLIQTKGKKPRKNFKSLTPKRYARETI